MPCSCKAITCRCLLEVKVVITCRPRVRFLHSFPRQLRLEYGSRKSALLVRLTHALLVNVHVHADQALTMHAPNVRLDGALLA